MKELPGTRKIFIKSAAVKHSPGYPFKCFFQKNKLFFEKAYEKSARNCIFQQPLSGRIATLTKDVAKYHSIPPIPFSE